jgi:hypothetical protein
MEFGAGSNVLHPHQTIQQTHQAPPPSLNHAQNQMVCEHLLGQTSENRVDL